MCVSPTHVFVERGPAYERVEAPCGWCWSCQKNRVNDLVGRCLLEASTSDWCHTLTLTYRPPGPLPEGLPDHQRPTTPQQMRVIHKQDFQDFMHRFRRSYQTRYLVAGEFGEKKGRVHFHTILFGKGKPPDWIANQNIHTKHWPFGHVFVDKNFSETSVRYVAKYLLKGAKRKKTRFDNRYNKEWLSYSRIPLMGYDFIMNHAAQYAHERIFPHSFLYRPPGAHEKREYQYQGEARFVFLDTLFKIWPEAMQLPKMPNMESAVLRYRKQLARRNFEALPIAEREKLLDLEPKAPSVSDYKSELILASEFIQRRMRETGHGKIETFREEYPDDYAVFAGALDRDLKGKGNSTSPAYS